MTTSVLGRGLAAAIALAAAAGLVLQFSATMNTGAPPGISLWILARFFTILTNLLVAATFAAVALNPRPLRPPWLVAGTTLSILLVGVIYGLLLHGLTELSGAGQMANVLLHMVTPVLAPLYWLGFAPKGQLRYRDTLIWAGYPTAYVVYALARGAADGRYPYPFIDVAAIGWAQTAVNCAAIGAGFLVIAAAAVWLDHRLGRRRV
jgi:hypothetical protein